MIESTKNTAHLLVTCCIEQTRFDVLKEVVAAFKQEQETKNISLANLWVFDNGSTLPEAREFIAQNFDNVLWANENYGFWSAINWFLRLLEIQEYNYDFIHIIESDHVFFALEKLLTCEKALERFPTLGSIRCQEFVVSEAHLYDKERQNKDSRSYAWVRQTDWDGKRFTFIMLDEGMKLYESKFFPLLHSVNRIDGMRHAFSKLAQMESFRESDFQKFYREKYEKCGIIDGGLFHTKLTWDSPNLSASWSPKAQREAAKYRDTRHDSITPFEKMVVT